MTEANLALEPITAKYLPFSSTVDSPFWVKYCHLKLEEIRLSEEAIPLVATHGIGKECNGRLQLTESSLQSLDMAMIPNDQVVCHGSLVGFNTIDAFQKLDKNTWLRDTVSTADSAGSPLVTRFAILTFADLKHHKVLYWCAFPAFLCSTPIAVARLNDSNSLLAPIPKLYHSLRLRCLETPNHAGLPPFFVCTKDQMELLGPDSLQKLDNVDPTNISASPNPVTFGFVDPSVSTNATDASGSSSAVLGWPMRNLIAFLSMNLDLGGQAVHIVSWRAPLRRIESDGGKLAEWSDRDNQQAMEHISLYSVTIPPKDSYGKQDHQKVVGWELNARQKPGPRWVNLKPLLDSTHLAIQAADLNLKLMKWRMIPSLDVQRLQQTKVLLLGAGTLGCSVARTLLGWGIRQFTLLDYGTVSYSNPVRQNLFTLEDCHFNNGAGKPKALAAAEALKAIAADVQATGVHLSIPMPGHASETKESLQTSVETLDEMIQECDVVFLLTDTRESRWLPTIMAAAHDKMLINAALGLDSWLVMRHGGGGEQEGRMGCYFCNDVVAPENSSKNRTLDQQCTVTRPGLAPIAASMAVELMVSMLHHPAQQRAPAPTPSKSFAPTVGDGDTAGALGVIPHQIRGSLVSYTMMTPTVPAFGCCTGCAPPIMAAYLADKMDLVQKVCHATDTTFLEHLSGLIDFRAAAMERMEDFDEDWEEDE